MIDDKVLLETVANLTKGLGGLQSVVAGISQLLAAALPNLSTEQKAVLEKGAATLMKDAEGQCAAGENLLSALRAYQAAQSKLPGKN